MCESYYEAIRTAPPSRIEAIDMGRRGLHNEGSELLMERLKNKIAYTFQEAPAGGRVAITTSDPESLAAIHKFLRFQITEHHTGDLTELH